MGRFTRGFAGRGRGERDPRLPPGQYDTGNELARAHRRGDTPARHGDVDVQDRGARRASDHVDVGRDPRAPAVELRGRHPLRHHVVEARRATSAASRSTRCSRWRGVQPGATHVLAFSHTGYTTNLPLADVTGGKAWVVWDYDGRPLEVDARRPGPAARAAPLLLEEREVRRRPARARPRRARVLGAERLPRPRRPLARAALPGRLTGLADDGRPARDDRGRPRRSSPSNRRRHAPRPSASRCPSRSPHRAGQHYVVRLTAPDGYTASRSYSIASAPDGSAEIELTVERLEDGEVSTFLHDDVAVGDELEVRGPIGGWFVWDGDTPALLVGGGSGIVPLMAMLRLARRNGRLGPRAAGRLGAHARRPLLRRRDRRTGDDRRLHARDAAVVPAAARAPAPRRPPAALAPDAARTSAARRVLPTPRVTPRRRRTCDRTDPCFSTLMIVMRATACEASRDSVFCRSLPRSVRRGSSSALLIPCAIPGHRGFALACSFFSFF